MKKILLFSYFGLALSLTAKSFNHIYHPAELNHIIAMGQSNAVGGGNNNGQPIIATADNTLTFPDMTIRHYRHDDDNSPADTTDASNITFREKATHGLRAPFYSQTYLGGSLNFHWFPELDGVPVRTGHWNHVFYKTCLDGVSNFQLLRESYGNPDDNIATTGILGPLCAELHRKTGWQFVASIAGIVGHYIEDLGAAQQTGPTGGDAIGVINRYTKTVNLNTIDPALDGWYGSANFANALVQVKNAKRLADSQGKSYKVMAVVWIQGESNSTTSNYEMLLANIADSFNTLAKRITGQHEDILFFPDLIGYNNYPGSIAFDKMEPIDNKILGLHESNDLFYLPGPRFYTLLNKIDPWHYGYQIIPAAQRWAQAIYQTTVNGKAWEPLRYKSHMVNGNNIDIEFYVPVPPLQFDLPLANSNHRLPTGVVANHGFEVLSNTASSILESVSIISSNTVRLTCSEEPINAVFSYAKAVQQNASSSILRGDLCDSNVEDTVYKDASGNSFETRNYAIPFESINVTQDNDNDLLPNHLEVEIGFDPNSSKSGPTNTPDSIRYVMGDSPLRFHKNPIRVSFHFIENNFLDVKILSSHDLVNWFPYEKHYTIINESEQNSIKAYTIRPIDPVKAHFLKVTSSLTEN